MKKTLTYLSLILLFYISQAQEVEWGIKVLEYSSEKNKSDYSNLQVLGKPNVFPSSGSNPSSWEPNSGKEAFIKVSFAKLIQARQLLIVETNHPGYLSQVFIYDADGAEIEVTSFVASQTTLKSRILNVKLDATNYVTAVKIIFKTDKNKDIGIDAIGISESDQPYDFKMLKSNLIKSTVVRTKLKSTVNSKYFELGPLPSPDGKTLYFSRKFDPDNIGKEADTEDIWFSKWNKDNKEWDWARNMGRPLNDEGANFINSISPDGNTILLGNSYDLKSATRDGVSISYRIPNGWTFPKRLVIEDEVNKGENANYFMANTQKTLLMALERKNEGFGGMDLYVSFLKPDSSWTKPLNLGNRINKFKEESSPFLAADNRTLYFASNGLSGYGGLDIYVTRRLDESWAKWSEPENMGTSVNTLNDESFFTMAASGKIAYFVSEGDSAGDRDIFTIPLPEAKKPYPVVLVTGKVINSKTNEPLMGVKILFENLETGVEVGIAKSSPEGDYQILLPSPHEYGYLAQNNGFVSVHEHMNLQNVNEYSEFTQDLILTPIEKGQKVVINNVFFDSEKYVLNPRSFHELNRLAKLLEQNSTMMIEIDGYTDSKGTIAYNDKLSYQRANSIMQYLLSKSGNRKGQFILKHHGESLPFATNSTKEGRKLNRRVEFTILEK